MKLISTKFAGVKLVEPEVQRDERGFFLETWNTRSFAELGIDAGFVQDNHSHSTHGVLRGLHYQLHRPQGKLVRVTRGRVFDVVVDLRRSSPTFGEWAGFELSASDLRMLWVPPGFAHGFLALTPQTDFMYKCTAHYDASAERSVAWNDPTIGVEWPIQGLSPTISDRDAAAVALQDAEVFP